MAEVFPRPGPRRVTVGNHTDPVPLALSPGLGRGRPDNKVCMKFPTEPRRAIDRFLQDPGASRTAAFAIISATLIVVVVGGILMRLLDPHEYPNFGRALWFTLQTVTTVGYGDDVPRKVIGRVIASVVMLTGIGFITVVTAVVTSAFVEAAQQRAMQTATSIEATATDVETDLAAVDARLTRMEQTLTLLVEQTRPR